MKQPRLPLPPGYIQLKKAWGIVGSSLVLTLCLFFTFQTVKGKLEKFFYSEKFQIRRIAQSPLTSDRVSTLCIAEWLDLSLDEPINLYAFDVAVAKKKMLSMQVVKDVKIIKYFPETIYVEYGMRKPLAQVGDFENTFVDAQGVIFPAYPFYTPKNLPEIYFGGMAKNSPWGSRVDSNKLKVAMQLLTFFSKNEVARIDLSHFIEKSLGRKEIDLVLQNGVIIRVKSDDFVEAIKNYHFLKQSSQHKEKAPYIADFRFRDVAYIKPYKCDGN